MNIISGMARNLLLTDLPGSAVRPTAIRARKALFDSLGSFEGKGVIDLCSGSGALALEAASRGAKWVFMVENNPLHIECIKENCRRVSAAGVKADMVISEFDLRDFSRYKHHIQGKADLIFADPPYAKSAEFFHSLAENQEFTSMQQGATLIWEIPDTPGAAGEFISANFPDKMQFRRFGSTIFLIGVIK
ncbi:MAG: hypothetical protein E7051_00285 [Lentisphaerae bacterium]|nr:hypothetical protein [Lentisphaerota bacterium]MBQ4328715.1 RsmD family RNA methyltransferase [Lentisphaeria bacterium]